MKIGIDIGGSHIGIGLINSSGTIIAKEEKDLTNNGEKQEYGIRLVNNSIELITKILDEKEIDIKQVSLIGMAIPGTVSNTHIIKADNLHIKDFNIVSEINKYFNIPVSLRNDAKCAAIAEKEYGGLKKYDDALFITLGTGIGGAVFLGGKLLRTKKYEGFEIGHMVIKKDGIKCNCGRCGCFEKYASMRAFKEKVINELNAGNLTGKQIKEILQKEEHNEKIEKILNEYTEDLSTGLANLINIFEPETISIGGSFVYFKDILLERLIKKLSEKGMLFNNQVPRIIMAKLKNDAGIIGSVIM